MLFILIGYANYHPFYEYLAIRKDYTVEVNCNPNDRISYPRRDIPQYNDWSREHSPALNTKETRKPRYASIREKNREGVHFRRAISSRAPSTKEDTMANDIRPSFESRARVISGKFMGKKLDTSSRDNALSSLTGLAEIFKLIGSRDARGASWTQTSLPVHEED